MQVWVHEEGGGGEWGTSGSWEDRQGIELKGTEEAFTLTEEVCTHQPLSCAAAAVQLGETWCRRSHVS